MSEIEIIESNVMIFQHDNIPASGEYVNREDYNKAIASGDKSTNGLMEAIEVLEDEGPGGRSVPNYAYMQLREALQEAINTIEEIQYSYSNIPKIQIMNIKVLSKDGIDKIKQILGM